MKTFLNIAVPIAVMCGIFVTSSYLEHLDEEYDGRPCVSQSENIVGTRLGEPVKWDVYVRVTKEELAKIRTFNRDDTRIREFDGKPHMRADLYMFYRDRLNP